jgi:hypothetical protein
MPLRKSPAREVDNRAVTRAIGRIVWPEGLA